MAAAPAFTAGQIVTVFRNRPRAEAAAEYADLAPRIQALAAGMPGFVDAKTFTADDGERVTIATFADEDSQRAWRDQVDHRAAQQAGRDRIYAAYTIQVCRTLRTGSHSRAGAYPLPADGAEG
jgi:heme-degrading monooxygenase HmoA